MTGLVLGYGTGSYFQSLVGMAGPMANSVYSVVTNPYFLAIILVLVAISLVPGSDN